MIDTVKLAWVIGRLPDGLELERLGWSRRFNQFSGEFRNWTLFDTGHKGKPRLAAFKAANGANYITIEVSLPAFVNGTNTTLLDLEKVPSALNDLAIFASQKSGQELQLTEAVVWRVDFVRDLKFNEAEVPLTIRKLAELGIPRFWRARYTDTTLYFHSGRKAVASGQARTICIYSKQAERRDMKCSAEEIATAAGVIRLEYRFRNAASLRHYAGQAGLADIRALTLVRSEIADELLKPLVMRIERLLEASEEPDLLAVLCRTYGPRRAAALANYLLHLYFYGADFFQAAERRFSRTSYFSCRKDCHAVGIYGLFGGGRAPPRA